MRKTKKNVKIIKVLSKEACRTWTRAEHFGMQSKGESHFLRDALPVSGHLPVWHLSAVQEDALIPYADPPFRRSTPASSKGYTQGTGSRLPQNL